MYERKQNMKNLLVKHQDDLMIAGACLLLDLIVFYRLGLL
jgi:hypothetical protein